MWLLYRVRGQASTKEQVSNRLYLCLIFLNGDPWHGVAVVGDAPDHYILAERSSKAVSVVDVRRPLTTPLIEGAECFGLDSEGCGGHV